MNGAEQITSLVGTLTKNVMYSTLQHPQGHSLGRRPLTSNSNSEQSLWFDKTGFLVLVHALMPKLSDVNGLTPFQIGTVQLFRADASALP